MTDYDPVSKNGAAISQALVEIWERFGKPEDFYTKAGQVLLKEIINVWKYFYRQEYEDTLHDNKLTISLEKHVSNMKMGYIPIAYPPILFNLIRAMFPNVNLSTRKSQKTIQKLAPFLKQTNLSI
jgi:hypothetical protein